MIRLSHLFRLPKGGKPKRNLAVMSTVDLTSVIGATYLQTVAMQRRSWTSEDLLPDRSNFAAHCRGFRRFNKRDCLPSYKHEEAWSVVLQAGMTLGQFPSAFIGDKS